MLIFVCLLGWASFLLLLFLCVFALKTQAHTESAFETFLAVLLLDPPTYRAEAAALRREIAEADGPDAVVAAATCRALARRARLDPVASRRLAERLILAVHTGSRGEPGREVSAAGPEGPSSVTPASPG